METKEDFPQVFAPGFPRCGTTYACGILSQHPEIHAPMKKHPIYPYLVKKEIHFFNDRPRTLSDQNSIREDFGKRTIKEYKHYFVKGKINIDFSICTAYDPEAIRRVKETLGDIKIIFFIRNIEDHKKSIRLVSDHKETLAYLHNFQNYIEEWKKEFTEVLIVDLEETKINPKQQFMKILEFIGAKDTDFKFNFKKSKHSSFQIRRAKNHDRKKQKTR